MLLNPLPELVVDVNIYIANPRYAWCPQRIIRSFAGIVVYGPIVTFPDHGAIGHNQHWSGHFLDEPVELRRREKPGEVLPRFEECAAGMAGNPKRHQYNLRGR